MRGRMLGFQLAHSLVMPAWDRDLNNPDMDWLLDTLPGTLLLVDLLNLALTMMPLPPLLVNLFLRRMDQLGDTWASGFATGGSITASISRSQTE